MVGFAAETSDLITHAKDKLTSKGLDLIVANDVTIDRSGIRQRSERSHIDRAAGVMTDLPLMPKRDFADAILNRAQSCSTPDNQPGPQTVAGGR